MTRKAIVLVLLLALAPAAVAAGKPKRPPLGDRLRRRVTITFRAAPFLDAFAKLRAECDFDGVVGPELRAADPKVSLVLKEMTGANALKTVAKAAGADCSAADGVVSVGRPEFIAKVRKYRAPHTLHEALHRALKKRVSVDAVNTPLKDVVAFLRKELKANIVVAPREDAGEERVTLQLTNVRGAVALKYVALLVGRVAVAEDSIVVLGVPPKPAEKKDE